MTHQRRWKKFRLDKDVARSDRTTFFLCVCIFPCTRPTSKVNTTRTVRLWILAGEWTTAAARGHGGEGGRSGPGAAEEISAFCGDAPLRFLRSESADLT
ncbi:hypothetical protein MTP99_005243 [Tenebrio molitor]|nr:hypothetical protein MTP99_005243 [Tenebrio molitor]